MERSGSSIDGMADLPDFSVVSVDDDLACVLIRGEWFCTGIDGPLASLPGEIREVVHVPVTDVEPPVGSIVQTESLTVWMYYPAGWRPMPFADSSPATPWDELRTDVTRILRWGE